MINELMFAHKILVYMFFIFLVAGFALPSVISDAYKFKKASFIYTMVFQAIASMVAFAGLVVLYAGRMSWDIFSISMVLVWAMMMFIEIKKYRLIKYADLTHSENFAIIKKGFGKISILQVLIIVGMIGVMSLKNMGVFGN
jgi:hypothetical protein